MKDGKGTLKGAAPGRPASAPPNATFSESGKYRRRGPRQRFWTQAERDSEVDRILALKEKGMTMADIADAMKMSRATLYRRMDSIKDLVPLPTPEQQASREKRLQAVLAVLGADVARAHELAEQRLKKRTSGTPDRDAVEFARTIEALRLAAALHKIEIDFARHVGVLERIKKSGRAREVINRAYSYVAEERAPAEDEDAAMN